MAMLNNQRVIFRWFDGIHFLMGSPRWLGSIGQFKGEFHGVSLQPLTILQRQQVRFRASWVFRLQIAQPPGSRDTVWDENNLTLIWEVWRMWIMRYHLGCWVKDKSWIWLFGFKMLRQRYVVHSDFDISPNGWFMVVPFPRFLDTSWILFFACLNPIFVADLCTSCISCLLQLWVDLAMNWQHYAHIGLWAWFSRFGQYNTCQPMHVYPPLSVNIQSHCELNPQISLVKSSTFHNSHKLNYPCAPSFHD